MALHKFTPGGCRQNCDTSGCCPDSVCAATVSHTFYTLRVYRDAVLVATYTLPKADIDFGTTVGCGFTSAEAGPGICGLTESWALFVIQKNGSNVQYGIVINDVPFGTPGPYTYLSVAGVVIGPAPVNCGQTLSGAFDYYDISCGVHAWTYEVEPGGTLCTAAASNSCCPCEDCRLLRDDFNRAAGTDLGANWTETAGQWTLESPSRLATDDTSAIVLSTTSSSAVGIAVTAKGASGDKIRLIAGYQNSSNYFYAEFTWGTGVIKLYKRASGSDTLLQTGTGTLAANEYARIFFCLDGAGEMKARTTAGAGVYVTASSTAPTGSQYGIGTGDTNSGDVQFALFDSYVISTACEACEATTQHVGCGSADGCCQQEDETYQYEVDLGAGGLTNQNCSACPSVAGVFVVTRIGSSCTWRYVDERFCTQSCDANPGCSGYWTLTITLTRQGAFTCRWHVEVTLAVGCTSSSEGGCGVHSTTFADAYEDNGEPCAGTWTLSRTLTLETATKPCTGTLPATIGLASV